MMNVEITALKIFQKQTKSIIPSFQKIPIRRCQNLTGLKIKKDKEQRPLKLFREETKAWENSVKGSSTCTVKMKPA